MALIAVRQSQNAIESDFEIVSVAPAGEGLVAAQWIMRGTNQGPMRGLPPTGRAVTLPGADFIQKTLSEINGYFNWAKLYQTQN